MKLQPIHRWVEEAIKAGGLSQAELSRKLSAQLRREIDRAAVNKMVSGKREVSADEMLAIETITGMPVPSDQAVQRIPLISWVSAGALADSSTQIPVDDAPTVAVANLGRGKFFALRVEGDSMDRISPEGSVIIVNRAEREARDDLFYVFSLRGETTYKRWHADPPYLAPHSTNPVHQPLFVKRRNDLEVIGRVRRTVLDL